MIPRRAKLAINFIANWFLAPFEMFITRSEDKIAGPIFVVGAPRSGTTLLCQLISTSVDVGYLTNRHCRWFRAPAWVEARRPTPFGQGLEFHSEFGTTEGKHAPSECPHYWYRFLPRQPHSLGLDDVSRDKLLALRRSISALSAASGRILIFKNLVLSLRIPLLIEAFPNAIFIVMSRDYRDTALSILSARQKLRGSINNWFSVRPATLTKRDIVETPFAEAVEQVAGIRAEIDAIRKRVDSHKFIDVTYENLCADPSGVIHHIVSECARAGLRLSRRTEFEFPHNFGAPSNLDKYPKKWVECVGGALRAKGLG